MDLQLTSIFQNIPAGIYVSYIEESTYDCVPTMMNDVVCQMTGFSRRDISENLDNKFSKLICKCDRDKYREAVSELNEFPHSITVQYRLQRKDGELLPVTDRMQSVRQPDGKMLVYACFMPGETISTKKNVPTRRVEIQTFGYFNVLVDGQPMVFHSDKSKELFALLVDRKGNYVSNRDIITHLWEDALIDKVTQSRCRKVVFNLRKTLEVYGLEDLIESKVKGYRRLNVDMVTCDLYQYLSGDEQYAHLFQGSYLDEYSWAEFTLSNLLFNN